MADSASDTLLKARIANQFGTGNLDDPRVTAEFNRRQQMPAATNTTVRKAPIVNAPAVKRAQPNQPAGGNFAPITSSFPAQATATEIKKYNDEVYNKYVASQLGRPNGTYTEHIAGTNQTTTWQRRMFPDGNERLIRPSNEQGKIIVMDPNTGEKSTQWLGGDEFHNMHENLRAEIANHPGSPIESTLYKSPSETASYGELRSRQLARQRYGDFNPMGVGDRNAINQADIARNRLDTLIKQYDRAGGAASFTKYSQILQNFETDTDARKSFLGGITDPKERAQREAYLQFLSNVMAAKRDGIDITRLGTGEGTAEGVTKAGGDIAKNLAFLFAGHGNPVASLVAGGADTLVDTAKNLIGQKMDIDAVRTDLEKARNEVALQEGDAVDQANDPKNKTLVGDDIIAKGNAARNDLNSAKDAQNRPITRETISDARILPETPETPATGATTTTTTKTQTQTPTTQTPVVTPKVGAVAGAGVGSGAQSATTTDQTTTPAAPAVKPTGLTAQEKKQLSQPSKGGVNIQGLQTSAQRLGGDIEKTKEEIQAAHPALTSDQQAAAKSLAKKNLPAVTAGTGTAAAGTAGLNVLPEDAGKIQGPGNIIPNGAANGPADNPPAQTNQGATVDRRSLAYQGGGQPLASEPKLGSQDPRSGVLHDFGLDWFLPNRPASLKTPPAVDRRSLAYHGSDAAPEEMLSRVGSGAGAEDLRNRVAQANENLQGGRTGAPIPDAGTMVPGVPMLESDRRTDSEPPKAPINTGKAVKKAAEAALSPIVAPFGQAGLNEEQLNDPLGLRSIKRALGFLTPEERADQLAKKFPAPPAGSTESTRQGVENLLNPNPSEPDRRSMVYGAEEELPANAEMGAPLGSPDNPIMHQEHVDALEPGTPFHWRDHPNPYVKV